MTALVVPAASAGFARGAALAVAAAFFWSLAGLFVRHVDLPAVEVSFWRSVFMLGALLPAMVWQSREVGRALRLYGWALAGSGLLLGTTMLAFIVSISLTTVANVLFVLATGPFITAILARLIAGEALHGTTMAAIGAAAAGIVLTLVGSLRLGDVLGLAVALIVPLAFSLNTVVMRQYRQANQLPAMAFAALFSGLMALPFVRLGALEAHHVPWLLMLGPIQLTFGLWLFTRALRYLPAAQASLIGVLEIVLGPLWVWLAYAERPTDLALAGGALVLAAVLLNGIAQLRRG